MELLINLDVNGEDSAPSPWANLGKGGLTPVSIPQSDGSSSGWTISYNSAANTGGQDTSGAFPTAGDAAWVVDEAALGGHTASTTDFWYVLNVSGPANTEFTVDGFSSSSLDRTTDWRVNGGAIKSLGELDNATNTATFTGVTTDGSGNATIEYKMNDGFSRANAIRITVAPGPSLTVTQTELTPGSTISGTYADYDTVPTTLTVSDGTNTITIASPTINDNGDGTGDFSGTMPELPTSGTANLILFGDVDVELT